MMLYFILDSGFAWRHERRFGVGRREINEPYFRRLVIVSRNVRKPTR
jgi:hypothetical protein